MSRWIAWAIRSPRCWSVRPTSTFNDDTPANDAVNDKWFSEFEFELDDLFNLIEDDLTNLGLKICARTS